ncbi:PREDICTED: origin recognition complex subunit 6 [Bactrocera latifrons]|uniref:Origin recognition complex subunit 6 n=2 Tax=Bactrocera latifrons TaxID=174628 RepID=A0A0K8WLN3_BACLA|nr:PREDICTED: origin recognition complex subunit 6 [Bactrocera latifrons]
MATLIEQMLTKMGLRDEPSMQSKTLELLRILELRSANAPLQLNEYAKTVLCADIATTVLGIACDVEQNVKLSTLRKSHYNKHKRMIEKILDVNKIVGVNDICVQLNMTEVSQKAVELLELYKTIIAKESANDENDLIHPQYAAMAVFQAAKILKQKSSKAKIMSFSNLRPTQWQHLELRWNKFLTKYYKETSDKRQRLRVGESNEGTEILKSQSCVENKKRLASSVEDYEQWKKRILEKAEEQLRHQLNEQEDKLEIDKENLILGM